MDDDLIFTPAVELARHFRDGTLSPVEVTEAVLTRIEALDPKVHAFITVTAECARADAMKAEAAFRTQDHATIPQLTGLPISVKDLTETAGVITTFGVPECLSNVPERDAPSWARLKATGPALLGKTSSPPYGWLGVTENAILGTTNNPWKLGHCVGGSSGGATAALAAGFGPLAVGSDGGGSIRIPAACCGVVGLKPSHGRIPRGDEATPFCTVDALGPMARTVADVALLLSVMAGPVDDEPYMLSEVGVDYVADLRAGAVKGLRIAYSPDLGRGPVDPEVAAIVRTAVSVFERDLGAAVDLIDISIPDPIDYFRSYWGPALAIFGDKEPRFVTNIQNKYPGLAKLVKDGHTMSATSFWNLLTNERVQTFKAFSDVFRDYDLLVLPTMPLSAFPHAGSVAGAEFIAGEKIEYPEIEFHRLTEPFSHTGHPAISVPCGFTTEGLPVGLQIVGRQRDDKGVLRAAAAYEGVTSWLNVRPGFLP
ncbi:amidase [Asticcacaulis benevestitus]|uniref:Amidase domain-containing protein n=1 Tax=Asticcacaulis benevestitus DSM 16100 = ATCC BAA-896 TaxID=1121022 RepID=V4PD24_9CAUL|nr:amidase family protein [Asticcacaulis benevestitus]ESQ83190.1 hypothetical protein ABENE_20425 [Asticcacaulis benevestitus DSM 16100 = ATCC BAA-896]